MPFNISFKRHLGVERIEKMLGFGNPAAFSEVCDLVLPLFRHEVEELGVEIIEALDGPDSREREGNERSSGQSILSGTLVEVGLVVVSEVEEHGVWYRAVVRNNDTGASGTFAGRWRKLFFASNASGIQRT